uniref:ATPase/GTPase, AAA15 family n=1 Tax=Candidatus Kentrum sp. FW TaxID=2126338 RepID=A0A450SSJ2_9GAMM|nr:MAG: ATPase/GTPase, AAA15 family [Candidatus Kentron sp. FW]
MSFQQVSIKNFRAIESLEMDNIKQVNLLTGKNNCGKTSVLEAIFLLAGMSNPQLVVNIHNFRGLTLNDNKDFSYLFHGFDFSKTPSMSGGQGSQERTLTISPIYSTTTGIVEQIPGKHEAAGNEPISSTITTEEVPDGLAFDFGLDEKSFHAEVKITQGNPATPFPGVNLSIGQINIQPAPNYRDSLNASFTNPGTIMAGLYQRIEAVLIKKKSDEIIGALREIEPNLHDLRLGTGNMIYSDITGIERLVPINIMGDGIIKILSILVTISEMRDGVLLIDEIENGLHYSALVPLWKAIFKMASASNVQLFIATHSYECIDAMADVYRESGMGEDFISLFRIEQDEGGRHYAVQYKASTLLVGIERNFEVR